MATFQRFEDIQAWQEARTLTKAVYHVTLNTNFKSDFALRDQIRRASISIMSNISEGFGRGGNKEFLQFLSIAKGSASELQAQLYIALDQDYLNKSEFDKLYTQSQLVNRLLGGLIEYLKKTPMKGAKYHKGSQS